jgi:S1-C subfamily serine protease
MKATRLVLGIIASFLIVLNIFLLYDYNELKPCRLFNRWRSELSDNTTPANPTGMFASVVRITCKEKDPNELVLGSGVIVHWGCDTRILTAKHVIEGATIVHIKTTDGKSFVSTVLATSEWDCAVLSIPEDVNVLYASELITQENVSAMTSDTLISCGYGGYGQFAFSKGHFSGFRDRDLLNSDESKDWIEIDGSCRFGDSGGPIFTSNGEVAGIIRATNGVLVVGVQAGRLGITLNEADESGKK